MSILYQVKIADYENMLLMDKDTTDIDKAINDELGGSQNLKLFLLLKDEIILLHRIEIAKIQGKADEVLKLEKLFKKAHEKTANAMPEKTDRYKSFVSWRNTVEKWRGSEIPSERNLYYLCESAKSMKAEIEAKQKAYEKNKR